MQNQTLKQNRLGNYSRILKLNLQKFNKNYQLNIKIMTLHFYQDPLKLININIDLIKYQTKKKLMDILPQPQKQQILIQKVDKLLHQ